jgi:hypothetical protein
VIASPEIFDELRDEPFRKIEFKKKPSVDHLLVTKAVRVEFQQSGDKGRLRDTGEFPLEGDVLGFGQGPHRDVAIEESPIQIKKNGASHRTTPGISGGGTQLTQSREDRASSNTRAAEPVNTVA